MWIQTSRGRAFDLIDPKPEDVDFAEIARTLAEISRFVGHVPGYSVAQHCALGADWLLHHKMRDEAFAFLLHDAHEFAIGDQASPVTEALESITLKLGAERGLLKAATRLLKANIDHAIWKAAGLTNTCKSTVATIDLRMLRTERDQLMAPPPKPWVEAVEKAQPLPIFITVWSRAQAASAWLEMFDFLSPARDAKESAHV